jgi:hypothetical protein
MSRIEITPERYQLFLDAFLALGPRFNAVAKRCGCSTPTARKAWERGWTDVPYAPAVSKVYADMLQRLENQRRALQAPARDPAETQSAVPSVPQANVAPRLEEVASQLGVSKQTPTELLQESAINAMQSEVDLLQAFRCNLIGAVTVANRLLVGFEALAGATANNLMVIAQNEGQATPERLLKPLERFARIMSVMTASTKHVMEMQRLLVGAPQQITEQRGITDNADLMAKAHRVFDMMRRSGLLPSETQPDAGRYDGEETDAVLGESTTREVIDVPADPT